MRKKWIGVLLGGLVILVGIGIFLGLKKEKSVDEPSELQMLRYSNGYLRTVSQEEYDFFEDMVIKDSLEELTEQERKEQTLEYINRGNAEFMIAYEMGLCEPYSFSSLKRQMELENQEREIKKKNGEVFYGPENFDLTSYYQYLLGNLELDMVTYILEYADQEVMEGAKSYFEEHEDWYQEIREVVCDIETDGKSERKQISQEEFSSLEKTDSELFEFLYNGKEGDHLIYKKNGVEQKVTYISRVYEELTFEKCGEEVLKDYISNVYLEQWIREWMDQNPITLKG